MKNITNPGTTSDPSVIKNATLEEAIDVRQVKSMYFGVYKTGNSEAGTFAWEFDSPANARQAFKKMIAKHAEDSDAMKFWVKDRNFVMVWHDPGDSIPCYKAFKSHAEVVLGKK